MFVKAPREKASSYFDTSLSFQGCWRRDHPHLPARLCLLGNPLDLSPGFPLPSHKPPPTLGGGETSAGFGVHQAYLDTQQLKRQTMGLTHLTVHTAGGVHSFILYSLTWSANVGSAVLVRGCGWSYFLRAYTLAKALGDRNKPPQYKPEEVNARSGG